MTLSSILGTVSFQSKDGHKHLKQKTFKSSTKILFHYKVLQAVAAARETAPELSYINKTKGDNRKEIGHESYCLLSVFKKKRTKWSSIKKQSVVASKLITSLSQSAAAQTSVGCPDQ